QEGIISYIARLAADPWVTLGADEAAAAGGTAASQQQQQEQWREAVLEAQVAAHRCLAAYLAGSPHLPAAVALLATPGLPQQLHALGLSQPQLLVVQQQPEGSSSSSSGGDRGG
ncbi:hypothetical protein Agub_g13635, partial [Astrephomene gubernaculifera]